MQFKSISLDQKHNYIKTVVNFTTCSLIFTVFSCIFPLEFDAFGTVLFIMNMKQPPPRPKHTQTNLISRAKTIEYLLLSIFYYLFNQSDHIKS